VSSARLRARGCSGAPHPSSAKLTSGASLATNLAISRSLFVLSFHATFARHRHGLFLPLSYSTPRALVPHSISKFYSTIIGSPTLFKNLRLGHLPLPQRSFNKCVAPIQPSIQLKNGSLAVGLHPHSICASGVFVWVTRSTRDQAMVEYFELLFYFPADCQFYCTYSRSHLSPPRLVRGRTAPTLHEVLIKFMQGRPFDWG
jgi:hypothetical protein